MPKSPISDPIAPGVALPTHQRNRPGFAQSFTRDAEQTIAAMDAGGHDIPNQTPLMPLRLRRVGVSRRSVPVRLDDPLGGPCSVELSCEVDAFVDLAADRRGIHVSRIGDLLARLTGESYGSLTEYAMRVHDGLRIAQESGTASVAVRGVLTYLESVRGVKDKLSLEHLELTAEAETRGGAATCSQGLSFNHITACPCVQETYRHSFGPEDEALHRVLAESRMPLLTHTQRCRTRVTIADASTPLALRPLLACVDKVVVRSQNTLPREFELLNVHRAHARPQFLEDAVRELTYRLYRHVAPDHPGATLKVHSSSMESIHDFDMEGEIEFTVAELDQIFADT